VKRRLLVSYSTEQHLKAQALSRRFLIITDSGRISPSATQHNQVCFRASIGRWGISRQRQGSTRSCRSLPHREQKHEAVPVKGILERLLEQPVEPRGEQPQY